MTDVWEHEHRVHYTRVAATEMRGPTMKNITFSADEQCIEAARARATAEHTTLNDQFRIWLSEYARKHERLADYDRLMQDLRGKVRVGRKLSRDEMNER